MHPISVSIEAGKKRTFAGATDWPGWCRSGRDEAGALAALLAYARRYGAVLSAAGIEFAPPAMVTHFQVVERVEGNVTTDFGAPSVIPACERRDLSADEYVRRRAILTACWEAFDSAVRAATGIELRKGSRGSGRSLEQMFRHVLEAEQGYLPRLAVKSILTTNVNLQTAQLSTRFAVLEALDNAMSHGLPAQGPRGGTIWPPRYFINRAAWHVLDHAWELEDRIIVPYPD